MTASDLAKCPCNHCGSNIEFEKDYAGATCECPHCGKETMLFVTGDHSPEPNPELIREPPVIHSEDTFFDQQGVKVTKTRFCIGNETYPIANITSVRSGTIEPSRFGPGCLVVIGLMILFFGLNAKGGIDIGAVVLGTIFSVAGGWVLYKQQPTYIVILGSSGQDRTGAKSKDRIFILRIIEALNRAIIARG